MSHADELHNLNELTNRLLLEDSEEKFEVIRQKFEEFYSTQKCFDQVASWHEEEKRYTLFSAKQNHWCVWKSSLLMMRKRLTQEDLINSGETR